MSTNARERMLDKRQWRNRDVEKIGLAVVSHAGVTPAMSGVVIGIKGPTVQVRLSDGSEPWLFSDLFVADEVPFIDAVDVDEDGPVVNILCANCKKPFLCGFVIEDLPHYTYDPARHLYYNETDICLECEEIAK